MPTRVVAGLLRDDRGRVLWAQRPADKADPHAWELPGGKREANETPEAALARELHEELGIDVLALEPWPAGDQHDPERDLELAVYAVTRWRGVPRALEHQALCWSPPLRAHRLPVAPLDRAAVRALGLPAYYAISPEGDDPRQLVEGARRALDRGARLLSLRLPAIDHAGLARAVEALAPLLTGADAELLVHRHLAAVEALDLGGVHLSRAQLWQCPRRPLPATRWVAASCHHRADLERAAALGLDFATLSPVHVTASHPQAKPLGWTRWAELVEKLPLPVYALGGVAPADLDRARAHGAWGVAGIRGFWS